MYWLISPFQSVFKFIFLSWPLAISLISEDKKFKQRQMTELNQEAKSRGEAQWPHGW